MEFEQGGGNPKANALQEINVAQGQSNIAMEQGPFEDVFPIESGDVHCIHCHLSVQEGPWWAKLRWHDHWRLKVPDFPCLGRIFDIHWIVCCDVVLFFFIHFATRISSEWFYCHSTVTGGTCAPKVVCCHHASRCKVRSLDTSDNDMSLHGWEHLKCLISWAWVSEPFFLRDDIKEALEKEERDQKAWMETPGLKFGIFLLPVRRGLPCEYWICESLPQTAFGVDITVEDPADLTQGIPLTAGISKLIFSQVLPNWTHCQSRCACKGKEINW